MRTILLLTILGVAAAIPVRAAEEQRTDTSSWQPSIVILETTRKQYDYFQPWSKRTRRVPKVGLVVGERQILTTADEMFDRTLVRLQKGGRGKWFIGDVAWIDYHANLAVVTTGEAGFWDDLKPVTLNGAMPADGALQVLRWREGKLENRKAEFTQFTVREGALAALNHVQLEAGSEIQGCGWGEPIIANSHVVGIAASQNGRTLTAVPASFVQSILEARARGQYRGLGYFHFYWQPAENPASLARLQLEGAPRGVLVIDVPERRDGLEQVLKPHDIILQIDGFEVDIQGDYNDPEFGPLMIENLATRRRWAGDEVKMKVWRDGRDLEVTYRLPKFDYNISLVPDATYDHEPEYLIAGGLVFQPLTDSYLQAWGAEWKRRAPFRLQYYNQQPATRERPALVLLSQVLPDAFNIGYQESRYFVVDKVNGRRISRLPELREALQQPVNGFHVIEFMRGEALHKVVLEAGDAERQATRRVLERYGIREEFHFEP